VVCDDGSTDKTLQILAEFEKQVSFPVHVFQNLIRLGSTKNFEKALQSCQGEILFFADQDDVWESSKISSLVRQFLEDPSLLGIFTDAEFIDEHSCRTGEAIWDLAQFSGKVQKQFQLDPFRFLLNRNVVTGATMAFRRSLFPYIFPFSSIWVHDAWIAIIAAALGNLKALDEKFIRYRRHSAQQLGLPRQNVFSSIQETLGHNSRHYCDCAEALGDLAACLQAIPTALFPHLNANLTELVSRKRHLEFRGSLPSSFLLRWFAVWKEATTGRYSKYSLGWPSIFRDLFRLP
jgi:glycosyltransferase involved in cell wall biosynthesis